MIAPATSHQTPKPPLATVQPVLPVDPGAATCGVEETRGLYRLAVEERYRFYSFGDAMLIL